MSTWNEVEDGLGWSALVPSKAERDEKRQRTQRAARVTAHTSTDEWWTPVELIRSLGRFDLDPCSPEAAPSRTECARQFTKSDDGLTMPWGGRVWMNPPYSTAGIWVEKLATHGDGVALVFARTETGWWHSHVWPKACALLFLRGRLSFIRGDDAGQVGHNAAAPSVLIAYGPNNAKALQTCGLQGAYVPLRDRAPGGDATNNEGAEHG